jgi:hypothetical protein
VRSSPLGLNVFVAHPGVQMDVVLDALELNMVELEPIRLKGSFVAHRTGLRVVEGHVRLSQFLENPNF